MFAQPWHSRSRLVYLCGAHGSGKSTLLSRLTTREHLIAAERFHVAIHAHEPLVRAIKRALKYYLEYRWHRRLLARWEDKVLIGDRCIYDTIAYVSAYKSLGWLSPEERKMVWQFAKSLFAKSGWPDRVLFLCPPVEQLEVQLRARWSEGEVGWREKDLNYLRITATSFEKLYEELARRGVSARKLTHCDLGRNTDSAIKFIAAI